MDFSLTRIGNENMRIHDSGKESRIQLVFVPGVFSGDAWRYQINYFSEDYRTVTFRPTVSNRDFEGHREALKQILEQEEMNNVVLIGSNYNNSLVQSFEPHEDVSATVLVGAKKKMKKQIPENLYRSFTSRKFPCKLFKKVFMSSVRYRDVKEFWKDVEFLEAEDFRSFSEKFGTRRPEKSCMIVHGERDFFSDRSYAKSLMSSASVTQVDAGSFSFYEKPQEFNKMLHDFLLKMERKAIKEKIEEEQEKNKTLADFQNRKLAKVNR